LQEPLECRHQFGISLEKIAALLGQSPQHLQQAVEMVCEEE
jgi:hypothetical protein